jgi:ATP dependent DNA ligase-like protein/DNA ligase-like protein
LRVFARLYEELDRTTSTNAKVAAMAGYFRAAPPGDAAWALFFLTQRKIKRLLPTRVLWDLTLEMTGVPAWLLEHCYAAVGDGAELVALLVDRPAGDAPATDLSLERWMEERVLPLKDMDLAAQARAMREYWSALDTLQILVLNKIITGEFRVGASATLALRALAQVAGVAPSIMAHRVMGDWRPSADFFRRLLAPEPEERLDSHPYPFFLASPLEEDPSALGDRDEWMAEWKWDGIRAQLVRRGGATFVWSRGEELVTERFPEVVAGATHLPDGTVLDGELLAFRDGVLPFSVLQKRIGRQKLTPSILADAPVAFMAFDLLEEGGEDLREQPLSERRARLESLLLHAAAPALQASPAVAGAGWDELARVREEARAQRGGADAEAALLALPHRPPPGRLVEVEDRAFHHRRRPALRASGPRAPRDALHGLHVRGLGPGRARARGQGILRPVGRRDRRAGRVGPPAHARALRAHARGRARAGLRAGLRGHRPLLAPPRRRGRALPADPAVAEGQAGGGGGHAGVGEGVVNGPGLSGVR